MQSLKVEDIIVPLAEYATVHQDATLYDAIIALANAQAEFDKARDKHRAILVLDNEDKVIGKLSQIDVIRGLEPGYEKIGQFPETTHWALSKEAAAKIQQDLQLWQRPLEDICKKSDSIRVRDIMYTPKDGEYVNLKASLEEAVHQLVMGRHQSLLVIDNHKVIGILRLTDVFSALIQVFNQCKS